MMGKRGRFLVWIALLLLGVTLAAPQAGAEPLRLSPAQPQPDEAALRSGLRVAYAYPPDVKQLADAETWNHHYRKPGPPLVGFDYPDTDPGDRTLTSNVATHVIAYIDGFVRFDRAGLWRIAFFSNDGLAVSIGGVLVYEHDGRHACQTLGWQEFAVPEPGWYAVEATFFQRLNTACLMMRWAPPGDKMGWTPVDVYGFLP
ncbi:MAG: hypothetical protein AAGC92_05200 [Pseudomonadota bacterium]